MRNNITNLPLAAVLTILALHVISGVMFGVKSQTLSERPVTSISPAPPVVAPAKTVTVSQALRFGEQSEPRPEVLAKRTDLPVITVKQPMIFDHDLLRWEVGFDRGDGYHKLRIRVTNLSDTPQGIEMLYSPLTSRDGNGEINWRIAANRLVSPGQTFSDWQSVLIENNLTKLVFLMRRRDDPAKERALGAYSRNPEASYPVPPAVAIIADLIGDTPTIVAKPNTPASTNGPLILPGMPRMKYSVDPQSITENKDNHLK